MNALDAKQILVVDDNFGDMMLFHEVLSDLNGYSLHPAIDVVQARAFLEKAAPYRDAPTPDLIFLDLRLPIFPGYCLLPTIRSNPTLRHVKVVIFTSSDNLEDRRRCIELGADEYLIKPQEWSDWKRTVLSVLERHCGISGIRDDASDWKRTYPSDN